MKHLSQKRGIALLIAIVVVSLFLAVGLNLTFIATKELSFSRLSSDSVKAHYAAESALECAVYWIFKDDGTNYFDPDIGDDHDIHCNGETINVGGGVESVIGIGAGTDQYSAVTIERTAPFEKKNFSITSEGFNEGTIGTDPSLVQQELGAVAIDNCAFDPDNVDSGGTTVVADTDISSSNLQSTLNSTYGTGSNFIEASSTNVGYQTWKIGSPIGNSKVLLQVTPLESSAAYTNTFGFYVTDTTDPYTGWSEIQAANAFVPVFSNKVSNPWGVPQLDENRDFLLDWHSFDLVTGPTEVVAFAIHTQDAGNVYFRTTEKVLNSFSGSSAELRINGLCIAPQGDSIAQGTELTVETCNSDEDQEWIQDGVYWRNAASVNQVIDVSSGDLTTVQIWGKWSGINQRWTVAPTGVTGNYSFESHGASGKCLESQGTGNILEAQTCDGSIDQQVDIVPVSGASGEQWALTFDVPEPGDEDVPEYVLAFEDQTLSGVEADYDDMVVTLKVVSCISQFNRY